MQDADTPPPPPPPAAQIGHNRPPLEASLALMIGELAADLQPEVAPYVTRRDELLAGFERFKAACADGIQNDDAYTRAGDFAGQLADLMRVADLRRGIIKKPIIEAGRIIDAFFEAALAAVEDARKVVLEAIEEYGQEKALIAQQQAAEKLAAAKRKADELAEAAKGGDALAEIKAIHAEERLMRLQGKPQPTDTSGARATSMLGTTVSLRKLPWQVRIVDPDKVPRQYMMPNEVALLAQAKTDKRISKGQQPIPGVEFFRETKAIVG